MRRSRSTPTSRFTGEYAPDGKDVRKVAREAAGNRCVRCLHPFETGKHGKGEWSPCDERCTHVGPIARQVPGGFFPLPQNLAAGTIVKQGFSVVAQWRILTVHHFDGNKANDAWWNLMSLCQRCHLKIQGKVNPETPYFFPHSEWIKPYVAGFYASKYEGRSLTREEVMDRMDDLLKYELRT